jgi:hypothetical protein
MSGIELKHSSTGGRTSLLRNWVSLTGGVIALAQNPATANTPPRLKIAAAS